MQNFEFHAPTRVIFGNDILKDIGIAAKEFGTKALLVYGQKSIMESGVYDEVKNLLIKAGISVTDYSGVKPNPDLPHASKGAATAIESGAEMIIAVGGGSVIDESKAIAAGACYAGNLWDFYDQTESIKKALPILAVQTLPATSSETNQVSVLTNPKNNEKFGARSPFIIPKIAFLDPSLTFTIPLKYTAYASFDIMSHLMEGYFTSMDNYTPVQDGFVEGLVKAVMISFNLVQKNPKDWDARASLMWAGALAWNGLCTAGVKGASIPNHMLEHPLSSVYDIAHGAGLSAIFPSWLRYKKDTIAHRIIRFGENILEIGSEIKGLTESQACDKIIDKFSTWIRNAGCPLSLNEAGIENPDIPELVKHARTLCGLWGLDGYTNEDLENIYKMAI
jgi:alcohol dehydrogenase YqhD (iron-dependent ADH family)